MTQIGKVWALAFLDLRLWQRMPMAVASALVPPLGMALLLVVLSLTVTQEPVALVIQSRGPNTDKMRQIIASDSDAYFLTVTDLPNAVKKLEGQEIAAIITIPPDFEAGVMTHTAHLQLTLNNIDIDFADDIRRSADRSVGQFDSLPLNIDYDEDPKHPDHDAPPLSISSPNGLAINPYHVAIDERDLRKTNVDFLHYQVLPVLVLLVLNVGLMGTALLCARDVERGTARLLVLSPTPAWVLVSGRLLGGLLASLAILVPAVVVCVLTGVVSPPAGHWPALLALFVSTALCASGMGAALGSVLRGTKNIAMAASLLATYLFFLGGGFTTIAFLPAWLRNISAFNPIRYAIDGMRQALFYPDLSGFSRDVVVLVGAAVLSVLIGSKLVFRSGRL